MTRAFARYAKHLASLVAVTLLACFTGLTVWRDASRGASPDTERM